MKYCFLLLTVDKCNEIQQLNDQIQRILLDNESFKQILKKFELEKAAVDYNNQELREQVAILEKGRGTNPISDAVIQENHHMEISKLQHNLETAFCKNQRLVSTQFKLICKSIVLILYVYVWLLCNDHYDLQYTTQ